MHPSEKREWAGYFFKNRLKEKYNDSNFNIDLLRGLFLPIFMELTINNFKKEKSFYYIALSNGEAYKLLPDIVCSHNLRIGQVLDEEKLNSIVAENNNQACFNDLLKILNRRPHTTFEIKTKLLKKGFNSSQVNAAIEKASELKLLNDKNTAEIYISELSNRGYGKRKIEQAMKQKGISSDTILELTSELCQCEKEEEKASDIFYKKLNFLKRNKSLTEQKIKERLFRFMQAKGFSNDIIFGLLRKISTENEDF